MNINKISKINNFFKTNINIFNNNQRKKNNIQKKLAYMSFNS